MSKILGCDLSSAQGDMNWLTLQKRGIQFAMLRLWYDSKGVTLGDLDHVDSAFDDHCCACDKYGIEKGVYVFHYFLTVDEAVDTANKVVGILKNYKFSYPVALDIEEDTIAYFERRGHEANIDIISDTTAAFLQVIENAGYYAMIYANPSVSSQYLRDDVLSRYGSWVACWLSNSSLTLSSAQSTLTGEQKTGEAKIYETMRIWQFGKGSGSQYGVSSSQIDLDINYHGDFYPAATAEAPQPAASTSTINVGDHCIINDGATDYNGTHMASWIYDRENYVCAVSGDRVVLAYNGVIVGAFRTSDITLI